MIKRCIMIFPKFNNQHLIEEIRKKYDPLFKHVDPHITLVFPFESNLDTEQLRNHLITKLKKIKPFPVKLRGITPSVSESGNFLFLNIEEGKEEVIKIHNKLYSGILEEFVPDWLKKVDYYPHMTVGNLVNEEELMKAVNETRYFNHIFETEINSLSVEIIAKNEDSIIELTIPLINRKVRT